MKGILQTICPECKHEIYRTEKNHIICPNCGTRLINKKAKLIISCGGKNVILKIENERDRFIGRIINNNLVCKREYDKHLFKSHQSINVNKLIMKLKVNNIIVKASNGDIISVSMEKIKQLGEAYYLEWSNNGESQIMIPLKIFDEKKANGETRKGLEVFEFDGENIIENWAKRKFA
jgi:uncharacterized Zn finger protein (UPF0148 family)